MNSFLIGLYGGFDRIKYTRDFQPSFFGIEACLFADPSEMVELAKEAKKGNFSIGIHYPFRARGQSLRDALFMDQDDATRLRAFEEIQAELESVKELKPAYVLFHYPKPVILDNRVNWEKWRFADRREYVFQSEYSLAEFAEKSACLFAWLDKKSEEYLFTPVLELDACNHYVYDTQIVEDLLLKHPRVKLCLDTGRLFLQEWIDPYFDAKKVLKKYARYAETIHLWTTKITGDEVAYNHFPALPDCQPEAGWAPIEEYLKIIRAENPTVKIVFEHRSEQISAEQLERCYRWVDQLLHGKMVEA